MKFEDFDLRQDPFPIAPESSVVNWAGDQEIRDELVDIVKGVRARDIGVSEFVVVHGEFGAGKSHALRYLRTEICDNPSEYNSLAIYLERPRVANKLNFENLAHYIMQTIGREKVAQYSTRVKAIVDQLVNDLAASKGMGETKDKGSFYEEVYAGFRDSDRSMLKLLARGNDQGNRVFEFLSGTAVCDGSEYEGKIDSDFMAAKVLSDFFRVLTVDLRPDVQVLESVYLFIDECEGLFEAKTSESDLVFSGLRELINGLPYRFGILMSFTAATALIEAVMPNHLLKRMTRPYIEIPVLDDHLAKDFLRSQLDFYRVEDSSRKGTFYPFSEEAVDVIIEHEVGLTPRVLFINCKRVFERAIRRHGLEPGDSISPETTRAILGIA